MASLHTCDLERCSVPADNSSKGVTQLTEFIARQRGSTFMDFELRGLPIALHRIKMYV